MALSFEKIYRETEARKEELSIEFLIAVLGVCGGNTEREERSILMDRVTNYRLARARLGLD